MEPYEVFIARINASTFLVFDDQPVPKRKKRKPSKVAAAVVAAAEKMGRQGLEDLLDTLDPRNRFVTVDGEALCVRQEGDAYRIKSERGVHTAIGDECSCEDHRFRRSFCKHLRAVQEVKRDT
jgi:hypothetical protein